MMNALIIEKVRWDALVYYPTNLMKYLDYMVVVDKDNGTWDVIKDRRGDNYSLKNRPIEDLEAWCNARNIMVNA